MRKTGYVIAAAARKGGAMNVEVVKEIENTPARTRMVRLEDTSTVGVNRAHHRRGNRSQTHVRSMYIQAVGGDRLRKIVVCISRHRPDSMWYMP